MKKAFTLLAIIAVLALIIVACKKKSSSSSSPSSTTGGSTTGPTSTNTITTIAGNGTAGFTGDGGYAINAELNAPQHIAVDTFGNVYIADYADQRIRKVSPIGIITTFAGNGTAGYSGDGGSSVNAQINGPTGITTDLSGNVYFADVVNKVIRKINLSGIITTIAGGGTSGLGDGGPAINAAFSTPGDVAIDNAGNIYIDDINQSRIRKIDVAGIITTVAGNGLTGFSGDGGPAVNAVLWYPPSIAVDSVGNVYISDGSNNRIRKIDIVSGIINTIAGNASCTGGGLANSGDGGLATNACVGYNEGIAIDHSGNIYISGYHTNRIRKINSSGMITTIAGTGVVGYSGDGGLALNAELNFPMGVATDAKGNIYVADMNNNCVRKITK